MAGPLMSAPVAAQQATQQSLQDQGSQQLKSGSSKFDGVMAEKADRAKAASEVQASAPTQQVQQTQQVAKTEKAANPSQQVTQTSGADKNGWMKSFLQPTQATEVQAAGKGATDSKMGNMAVKLMDNIEKGQGVMDKLIEAGLSGRQFSNSELIALQAGVFKYSQELELTGKVVDKATNGLKDTLKTQV